MRLNRLVNSNKLKTRLLQMFGALHDLVRPSEQIQQPCLQFIWIDCISPLVSQHINNFQSLLWSLHLGFAQGWKRTTEGDIKSFNLIWPWSYGQPTSLPSYIHPSIRPESGDKVLVVVPPTWRDQKGSAWTKTWNLVSATSNNALSQPIFTIRKVNSWGICRKRSAKLRVEAL